MRKICTILMMSMMVLWATAQSNYFFDMDDLVESEGLYLPQNKPNPFDGSADVYLAVVDKAEVSLVAADVYGHIEAQYSASLEPGVHRLKITLRTKGTHVLGLHQNGKMRSIVLFCNAGGSANRIDYCEFVEPIDLVLYEQLLNKEKDEDFVAYGTIQTAKHNNATYASNFRVALSLSPFTLNQFEQGYTFRVGDKTATTPAELQQIYRDLGSTEMYVRLATKRHKTYKPDGSLDNTTDGKADENANVHTFDQVMQTCRIAAALNIPINPEVMCAYIYMDMDHTQAPRFYKSDYPELYATNSTWASILQNGNARWEDLSLNEICTVLEIYGEFVADSILATGCTVRDWNLGNEANFGFAGIGIGEPNSFDKKLAKAGSTKRYVSSIFSLWWLKKHVWKHNVKQYAALKRGILRAYAKAGKDASGVRFSTHIATVTSTPRASASFFLYMAKHGYSVDIAGISYYPSAPALSFNKKKMLTKTVTRINKKCHVPVFIGEFSYPSQGMVGPFAGWNKQLGSYKKNQKGQAEIYRDVITWGKEHGMIGIRYWAPDYEGQWYPMSMFTFENKVGTAKQILVEHKNLVK